jgi:hypothetical protein
MFGVGVVTVPQRLTVPPRGGSMISREEIVQIADKLRSKPGFAKAARP